MRYLTTGEIAEFCGVHFRTVIRWIEKGLLTAHKLPGRGDNRVKIEDMMDFLRANNIPIPDEFRQFQNRVLIVDDNAAMAASINRSLKAAGYQTFVAKDGFQAGSMIMRFTPAVMTLDLKMPGIDGFRVIEYVRNDLQLHGLRILVISEMPASDLERAIAMGADYAIDKMFEKKDLLARIDQLMSVNASNLKSLRSNTS